MAASGHELVATAESEVSPGTAGERLAARLRDHAGSISRLVAPAAPALASAWRASWASLAAGLLLLGTGISAVALWRHAAGLPSPHDLQVMRDTMLLLLEAVVLLAALALLLVVVLWLFHADPAVISPFANATGIPSLTAVSDLLVGHLDRISAIQRTPIEGIPGERLRSSPVTPRPETIDSSLANVGSINLGQASISIGQLLIALKRMLPARGRGTAISGSVQQYGGRLQVVATVQRGRLMDTVMAGGEAAGDDSPILTLVPELAYRIHFTLAGRRMAAGTWELLRCFTEARAAYRRYLDGGRDEDRNAALDLTWQAYGMDRSYPRLFGMLYGLGTSYFATSEYATAIDLLQTALEVAPRMPQALVQQARCHYALEQDDQARRVLALALAQPPGHPTAQYLMGLLSGTAGQPTRAIEELARVPHRPRALRSAAWVTIAGLRLQAGDGAGHRKALRHVAARDFDSDVYSRACWLSVSQRLDDATDTLRQAFAQKIVPVEYALRDPDLVFVRMRCGQQGLRTLSAPAARPCPVPHGQTAPAATPASG